LHGNKRCKEAKADVEAESIAKLWESLAIDYSREEGRFLMSKSCVTIKNLNYL
jgi:hypothetical protein